MIYECLLSFSYMFLSLSLPVSHKYGNVLLCPDAEGFNLATTLWILQLNQPIREQLNQEVAGTRAVDAHSSCSHPKVRGHDMNLILYDEFLLLPPCVPPLHLQNVSIHSCFIFLISLPQSLSVVQFLYIQSV